MGIYVPPESKGKHQSNFSRPAEEMCFDAEFEVMSAEPKQIEHKEQSDGQAPSN